MKSYKIKEACFACTTPYQVIGAISIARGLRLNADLYVFGMFPNYDVVAKRLEKYGIFDRIYPVDCTEYGPRGRAKGFRQMLFANKEVSFFLPDDVAYNAFYSSSRALPKVILQAVLKKRNPEMWRIIYEDGMGTYLGQSHPLNATSRMRMAEKLLGWNIDDRQRTTMMAHFPRLVDPPAFIRDMPIETMPSLNLDRETTEMLNDVFSVDANSRIEEKYIIFDTVRPNPAWLNEEDHVRLDACYDLILESAGYDNVIYKPHPRSLTMCSSNIKVYSAQEIPIEVLYCGMNDLEQRVLIAYNSSATFSPKMLFGTEPSIISLHEMLPEKKSSILYKEVFEKFKKEYTDGSRISAPRDLEELKSVLEALKGHGS